MRGMMVVGHFHHSTKGGPLQATKFAQAKNPSRGNSAITPVWDDLHWRYLASKPMPVTQVEIVEGAQRGQQAA